MGSKRIRFSTFHVRLITEIPGTDSISALRSFWQHLPTPFPKTPAGSFCFRSCAHSYLYVSCSRSGQAQWWRQALQLHSQELLRQLKRGAEAHARGLLSPLPPRAALWGQLWLWDHQLEILHLQLRENCEKVSWGMPFSNVCAAVLQHCNIWVLSSCKCYVICRVLDRPTGYSCSCRSLHKGTQPEGW